MIFIDMKLKLKLFGLLIGAITILSGCGTTTGYVSTTTPVYYSDPFYDNPAWMYGYGCGYYMSPASHQTTTTTVIIVPPPKVIRPHTRPTPPPVPHNIPPSIINKPSRPPAPAGPPMPPMPFIRNRILLTPLT